MCSCIVCWPWQERKRCAMRLTICMKSLPSTVAGCARAPRRIHVSLYFAALLLLLAPALAQNHIDIAAEQQLLGLLNQERAQHGIPAVELDQRLTRAARKHTQQMVHSDSLVHQLPGEEVLSMRIGAEDVRSDHDAENIAFSSTAAQAHDALMQSPPHRANILNPQFNAVGIAVVQNGDRLYVTQDFAHVLPNYSEFEADAAAQQAIQDFVRAQGLPLPARKVRTQLTHMACDMAAHDKLDSSIARDIPGVTASVAWTAADVSKLPAGLKSVLSQPLPFGYALGVCFATSISHPAPMYWLLFVVY